MKKFKTLWVIMKKKFNDNLIILVIIIVASIFLIVFLLDLFNITEYVPLTKKYDWLSFVGGLIGSIIGGIITYKGVKITIDNQNKTDSEKTRLSIIPILDYKISYDKEDFDNSKGQLAGEICSCITLEKDSINPDETEKFLFNIKITNIGAGHAQIIKMNFNIIDNDNYKLIKETEVGYEYKLVRKDETKNFLFNIYAPYERFYKENIPIHGKGYNIEIVILYQDLLGNEYSQKIYSFISKSVLFIDDKIMNHSNFSSLSYYEKYNYLSKK